MPKSALNTRSWKRIQEKVYNQVAALGQKGRVALYSSSSSWFEPRSKIQDLGSGIQDLGLSSK